MLSLLHIENIAVIQAADIRFDAGFNALTGETGAGKSIVVDAIGAVIGERTSRELIRTGAQSAVVSAQPACIPWKRRGQNPIHPVCSSLGEREETAPKLKNRRVQHIFIFL